MTLTSFSSGCRIEEMSPTTTCSCEECLCEEKSGGHHFLQEGVEAVSSSGVLATEDPSVS